MKKNERKKLLDNIDMEDIINQIHYGLSICNNKGEMLYVSESYEKIYNIKIDDIIGRTNRDTMITKNPVSDAVLEMGKKITTKQENRYGTEMFVTGVPIFSEAGQVKYVVAFNSWEINDDNELLHKYEFLQNENSRLQKEISFMSTVARNSYKHIIAQSEEMKEILTRLKRSAAYDVPIFISGERGVGKRHLAVYAHENSDRRERSLHVFNVSDLGDMGAEEILFGTGSKNGIFEICKGDTLVIESVETMTFSLQNKIARFIDTSEYIDVLGEKKTSDVKIIFTAEESAASLVEKKRISPCLYYQIGKFEVEIPPLRQRMKDLDYMIDYCLDFYNKRYEKNVKIGSKAKIALLAYSWPDNVREVRFVLEQIVLEAGEKEVTTYQLPQAIKEGCFGNVEEIRDLKAMLEYYEGKIIVDTYKRCKSSVELAKELNISQPSASRKILKYCKKGLFKNE